MFRSSTETSLNLLVTFHLPFVVSEAKCPMLQQPGMRVGCLLDVTRAYLPRFLHNSRWVRLDTAQDPSTDETQLVAGGLV